MSNLVNFAEKELRRSGWFDKDSLYGDMMGHAVLTMIKQFSDDGHSGMSASLAVGLFSKLARWEPLTPLTGDHDEWNNVGDGVWQNNRCSRIFKDADGRAYDIEGKIFREPDGCCFTNRDSRVYVTFPYTPATEYVDVEAQP